MHKTSDSNVINIIHAVKYDNLFYFDTRLYTSSSSKVWLGVVISLYKDITGDGNILRPVDSFISAVRSTRSDVLM